jgi:hypothetical protein
VKSRATLVTKINWTRCGRAATAFTSTQAVCRSKRTEVQRASLSIQQLGRNERRLSRRFRQRSSCGEASVARDVPDLAVLGAHGSRGYATLGLRLTE